jgi:hypothetical protein
MLRGRSDGRKLWRGMRMEETQVRPTRKMHVLKIAELEISQTRPAIRVAGFRGPDPNAPDLVCGSCGAVLAVGWPTEALKATIACNACDAVNRATLED